MLVAFVEGILVVFDVIPRWVAIGIAVAVIAGYFLRGRQVKDPSGRQALWAITLSQAVVLLVPGQPDEVLGIELAVIGVLLGVILVGRLGYGPARGGQTVRQWLLGTGGPLAVLVLSLVLAGVGIGTGTIGGLVWLAPAVLAAVLSGTAQAWVLLVEIRR